MASQWHPIFLTTEVEPGIWVMTAAHEQDGFGRILLRRVPDGRLRYKVLLGGELLGWATSLQLACEHLYIAHQRARAAVYGGPPNGRPGRLSRDERPSQR